MKKDEKVLVRRDLLTKGKRKLTETQIDALVESFNQGKSRKALCSEFGISAPTVRKYLRERLPKGDV